MPVNEPALSTQEATAIASACNQYDNDFHGAAWTVSSVNAVHDSPGSDVNQTKKLIRLLGLYAIATG